MQDQDNHDRLRASYSNVARKTWLHEDLQTGNLEVSRDLFTPESMARGSPRPKDLEVVALLAGLPFGADVCGPLRAIQEELSGVIGDALHYWVEPDNLGIEFCVFKWPDEPWYEEYRAIIEAAINDAQATAFRLAIGGVQINPDGCVVACGYDPDGVFFSVREQMKAALPFLPKRQSGWAHIPVGRILEPVGKERFAALSKLAEHLVDTPVVETMIDSIKLIRETRWYMEERTVMMERVLERGA